MHGGGVSVSRWVVLISGGLVALLLLACVVPSSLTRGRSGALLTPTPPPHTPAPTAPQPGGPSTTWRISEQEMNDWLRGWRTHLGGGVDCQDMQVAIRTQEVMLRATVEVAQLPGALVPVEVRVKPVVREQQVALEVLDVQLGGAYAPWSALVKPLVATGIAQGLDLGDFLKRQRGVCISAIELHDGYMIVTGSPAAP